MKKKLVSMILTTALTTVMLAGTVFGASTTPAWNTENGEASIDGEDYVVAPTLEVALPGDLMFGINPARLDADGDGTADGQIISAEYQIINLSNVAVHVETKTALTADSSVTLATLTDATDWDDDTTELKAVSDSKAALILQLVPTSAATIKEEGITLGVTDITYDGSAVADDVDGNVLSASDSQVDYILDSFDGETLKAGNVSGFKFSGAVDPNAVFADGDIKVTTKYKMNIVTDNQKTALWTTGSLSDDKSTGFDSTVVTAVSP